MRKKLFIPDNAGFTLAGVLVALAMLLILMGAAAVQWSFIKKRAKEEELIFRGRQYSRALRLYYQKFNTFPNELKELIDEKCIRKLYKDPMTEDGEWGLIRGTNLNTAALEAQMKQEGEQPKEGIEEGETNIQPSQQTGPIIGIHSKSTEKSIKELNGQRFYNLWVFIADMGPKPAPQKPEPQPQQPTEEQRPTERPEQPPEEPEAPPE